MKITDQLITFESHEMAPPGWKTVWDRYGPINFLLQTHLNDEEIILDLLQLLIELTK